MTTRRYDLDAADDSAHFLRDQEAATRWDADRCDKTTYIRVAGQWMSDEDVPHPADVADLSDECGGRR